MDGTRALNFELAGCNASDASRSWLFKRQGLKQVVQSSLGLHRLLWRWLHSRPLPECGFSMRRYLVILWDGSSDPISHRRHGFNVPAACHSSCSERRLTAAKKNDKSAWDFVLDALMAPASLGTCERRESAMSRPWLQNVCLVLGHNKIGLKSEPVPEPSVAQARLQRHSTESSLPVVAPMVSLFSQGVSSAADATVSWRIPIHFLHSGGNCCSPVTATLCCRRSLFTNSQASPALDNEESLYPTLNEKTRSMPISSCQLSLIPAA
jgi:hypothetical protein